MCACHGNFRVLQFGVSTAQKVCVGVGLTVTHWKEKQLAVCEALGDDKLIAEVSSKSCCNVWSVDSPSLSVFGIVIVVPVCAFVFCIIFRPADLSVDG
jgi:hypothetical protein